MRTPTLAVSDWTALLLRSAVTVVALLALLSLVGILG
jgi:hypothetical protein